MVLGTFFFFSGSVSLARTNPPPLCFLRSQAFRAVFKILDTDTERDSELQAAPRKSCRTCFSQRVVESLA